MQDSPTGIATSHTKGLTHGNGILMNSQVLSGAEWYLLKLCRVLLIFTQGSSILHFQKFGPCSASRDVQADLLLGMSDASSDLGILIAASAKVFHRYSSRLLAQATCLFGVNIKGFVRIRLSSWWPVRCRLAIWDSKS